MPIFTPAYRDATRDDILSFCHTHPHIIALVAVGSGAYGYTDELSDLDFVIALDDDANMLAVMDYVSSHLRARGNYPYFKQAPERHLQVYLRDDFLEIDIGYGAYTRAAAHKAHWKVLFDRSGTVDDAMRRSWERIQNAPNTEAYARCLTDCADQAWHLLMQAAAAIKRGQVFRAAAELQLARDLYVSVLGSRYGIDTAKGRDLDKLPTDVLATLQGTMVCSMGSDALWQSLTHLTNAIYAELACADPNIQIPVTRAQVLEYLQVCRNL